MFIRHPPRRVDPMSRALRVLGILMGFFLWILPAPQTASAGAQDAKSLALMYANPRSYPAGDELLNKLRADPTRWGPLLEQAAQGASALPRLRIDVARAFVYAGDKKSQLELAAKLLGSAPFTLLDRSEWLYLCQKVAQRAVNAMPCARRLLSEDSFLIPMLGGFDGVGKNYALVFLLLQMPEQLWNREVGDRLWRGQDSPSSQIAMLDALFYAVSLRDDAILARYADDATRPPAARARANILLSQMSAMERNATEASLARLRSSMSIPTASTEEDLRQARRQALRQVSRDALLELERYTFLIRAEALMRWNKRLRSLG